MYRTYYVNNLNDLVEDTCWRITPVDDVPLTTVLVSTITNSYTRLIRVRCSDVAVVLIKVMETESRTNKWITTV